jgi:hypothetical protein
VYTGHGSVAQQKTMASNDTRRARPTVARGSASEFAGDRSDGVQSKYRIKITLAFKIRMSTGGVPDGSLVVITNRTIPRDPAGAHGYQAAPPDGMRPRSPAQRMFITGHLEIRPTGLILKIPVKLDMLGHWIRIEFVVAQSLRVNTDLPGWHGPFTVLKTFL